MSLPAQGDLLKHGPVTIANRGRRRKSFIFQSPGVDHGELFLFEQVVLLCHREAAGDQREKLAYRLHMR